jgi:hypothetical protein
MAIGFVVSTVRFLQVRKKNFALLLIGLCSLIAVTRLLWVKPASRVPVFLVRKPNAAVARIGDDSPEPSDAREWDRNDHENQVGSQRLKTELTDEDRVALPPLCAHRAEESEPLQVDDQGRICLDHNMDHDRGCCVPSRSLGQYTCRGCIAPPPPDNRRDEHKICCELHADCTSCCMGYRRSHPRDHGHLSKHSDFILCVHECRTNSRSVNPHGRGYEYGENHHCFQGVEQQLTLEHFETDDRRPSRAPKRP